MLWGPTDRRLSEFCMSKSRHTHTHTQCWWAHTRLVRVWTVTLQRVRVRLHYADRERERKKGTYTTFYCVGPRHLFMFSSMAITRGGGKIYYYYNNNTIRETHRLFTVCVCVCVTLHRFFTQIIYLWCSFEIPTFKYFLSSLIFLFFVLFP